VFTQRLSKALAMHAPRPTSLFVLASTLALTAWVAAQQPARPKLADYFTEIPATLIDPGYTPRSTFSTVNEDLNGDGHQDLVVLGAQFPSPGDTAYTPQPGRVYLGDGNGHFAPAPTDLFPVDTLMTVHPRQVLFADFNADGRADMFISSHGWDTPPFPGEQNRLYLSRPGGGWSDATSNLPQLSDFSHAAAAGDISGRGIIDIFVGNGSGILPYTLLNTGGGQFTQTRTNIPADNNQLLDTNTGHILPGATLTDLDGDGLPELIVTGDSSSDFKKIRRATILWNRAGVFVETDTTELPATTAFGGIRVDHDVQRIDVNQDGLPDLVLVGRSPYEFMGWFVQILVNKGNRQFADETAARVPLGDASGSSQGTQARSPLALWVRVLDFNHDGAPDFSVEFNGADFTQRQPLIWLNDGSGYFSTLKVGDFVAPGNENVLGSTPHLMATRNGYSFITQQYFQGSGGMRLRGLLATRPYRTTPTILPGGSILSDNGQFRLTYQSDGNLVLYDVSSGLGLWSTGTAGTQPGRVPMQGDGNFVVYDAAGVALWASGTSGNPNAYLQVHDDGRLVIYRPDGLALWNRTQ
jgi:hypothetical protein